MTIDDRLSADKLETLVQVRTTELNKANRMQEEHTQIQPYS